MAVLAGKKAREAGAQEALIMGEDGEIVEGATSNLFWLEDETLWTVPLHAGILEGVTRRYLIETARSLGLEVREL